MDEPSRDIVLGPEQWQLLADRLGLGLLRHLHGSLRPINEVMAGFVADCAASAFAVEQDDLLWLRDRHSRIRRFQSWTFGDHWLVQEIRSSLDDTPERPASRSHPILWLSELGAVSEGNAAAGELLAYFESQRKLEARLSRETAMARRDGESAFDLDLNGRIFEFVLTRASEGYHLFGAEVTERRHGEGELRQSEARLAALLAAAPDAIVTVAQDGCIGFVNPRGERMFGYGTGALRNEGIERIVPDWFLLPQVVAIMGGGATACIEQNGGEPIDGVRADETRFPVEISTSPLDREGEIHVMAIIRDVTEREAAAREIRALNQHLEKHVSHLTALNSELESFSYSVSHDLRGPLRSIDGFSAILHEEYADRLDAEALGFLARIRAATGRMSDLIDGLLRLGRITRAGLKRETVDLSQIAHVIAEGLAKEAPERCADFRIEEGVVAEGDRALLTVVMENLLGNAWKFTGGSPCARIAFDTEKGDGKLVFRIQDNGSGFDMRYAGKLFQPFERLHDTEFPGTGIGLATVQRVIRRHGGEVWAEGRMGEGATFYFTLGAAHD